MEKRYQSFGHYSITPLLQRAEINLSLKPAIWITFFWVIGSKKKIGMYKFLDYFFIVFHGSLVIFNLTGWAWRRTRRLHFISIGLTILSWFGLGIFYGWGYCPFTDWHWAVKRELGETNLPNSYVKYYVDKLTAYTWDPLAVDAAVLILGVLAFTLSCWLNLRDYHMHRNSRHYDSSLK